MRDVFSVVAMWLAEARPFALATLTELRVAKTAPIGTTIAVALDEQIVGNIGAGCHETEIIQAALRTAVDGVVRRIDVNLDDDELTGGTACGAAMRLVVWRPAASLRSDALAIAAGNHDVKVVVDGFEHVIAAKEPLILVGATALAQDLAALAGRADFRVTVVDPRSAFATRERLPDAHEILRQWPDDALAGLLSARTALVVLSHDPKLDIPALRCGLRSEAWYIGLLGSRRAQRARRITLRAEGFDDSALARIHGPAGLDIGGTTTAETAVSILSEIIAVRSGRKGNPLAAIDGAIH
jgi:xanthine dehydrogenase accessory factor